MGPAGGKGEQGDSGPPGKVCIIEIVLLKHHFHYSLDTDDLLYVHVI